MQPTAPTLCFLAAYVSLGAAPSEPLVRMETGCAFKDLYAHLAEFHRGTTPCLRYQNECDPNSEGPVDRAASTVVAMGITPAELAASEQAMFMWAHRAETRFHRLPEEEEYAKAVASTKRHGAGPATFEVPLFRPLARKVASDDRFSSLTPEQRERVKKAWEAQPVALSRSFAKVLVGMKRQINRGRLEKFTAVIQAHYQESKAFPPPASVELPLDADGRPFGYRVEEGKAVFGVAADYPGGWLAIDASGVDTYHPPPRASCELKDGASYVLDAKALTWDPSAARIVPAFEAGQLKGVKIFSVQEGSYFDRICLINGDIIAAVNDAPVTGDGGNLSAVRGRHRLRILRGGASFSISVGPK